jgi:hypothetical protein
MLEIAIKMRMNASNYPFLIILVMKTLKELSGEKTHIEHP